MTNSASSPARSGMLDRSAKWVCAFAFGVVMVLGGCSSSPLPPVPSGAGAYEAGNYSEAYRLSASEYARTSGARRDRAALTAGLSAHAEGKDGLAESWLIPLENNADPAISGRAQAALGLIAQSEGEHERAAALLSRAARKLDGEASARANFQAAESYAALGHVDSARLHYRLARGATARTGEVRTLSDERLDLTAYTVQVGAFARRSNAVDRASALRNRALALGIGEPRIVERTSPDGRTLNLVQVGRFDTLRAAQTARIRLGGDAVVAPAARE